jgi:3-deoxy-D-manno-octulosonate 8-phosphate phosphatase (KDO 8-P phosphatase)
MNQILNDSYLSYENFAYIGDDYNDLEILSLAGLSGCPADAMLAVKAQVDYICHAPGGFGAFREFAELIIHHKTTNRNLPYGL